jgi:hypothetical protein
MTMGCLLRKLVYPAARALLPVQISCAMRRSTANIAMQPTNKIITAKFLSVCTATDAFQWLKDRREKISNVNHEGFREDHEFVENVLLDRCDPYIDFGLARYGLDHKVPQKLYDRGDEGLRCTILANTPRGGFNAFGSNFAVAQPAPDNIAELLALVSNPNLDDQLFEACFERKGLFSQVSEDHYRSLLYALGDNPRLARPYDDHVLDGWSDYSYHKVFTAAWNLTLSLPTTKQWAVALSQLLKHCLPPTNFDAVAALLRWYIDDLQENSDSSPAFQYGFYLRTRIADLLKADETLLKSGDIALRASFYRRFDPKLYSNWATLAERDGEAFLEAALANKLIWKSEGDRDTLSQLCWDHPDPQSNLDMPNFFRAREARMRTEYPDWFSDAQASPTMQDVMDKLASLEDRLEKLELPNKSFFRK